ncbi:helix-hairpin-helix domain-containing protein [Natronorarus salvus]|uniref:helix-hairpin-helix domain-containing protein n=1 Tax=Natronorarus salvus TaxID=3117733 RepID=UPI002F26234F
MSSRESERELGVFVLEELPRVDASKLEPVERAAIERAVHDREELLVDLQTRLVELRGERNAFERRIEALEGERTELRERLEAIEEQRPRLVPTELFSEFTTAVGGVREELEGASTEYTVGDVEFDLKANVITSDDGIRFQLPSLGETVSAGTLSDVRFTVRRRSPMETAALREVPEVRYLPREGAIERLEGAGFTVGAVDTETTDDEVPDTVVAQFPSPYSVVPPEVEPVVDLVISERAARGEEERAIEETELDAPKRIDVREIPGIGRVRAGHLEEAGITRLDQFAASNPDEMADVLEVTPHRAERWIEYARTLLSKG